MNPTTYAPRLALRKSPRTTPNSPLSRGGLTRDNAALVVIDYQVGPLWELEFGAMRRRVAGLASLAQEGAVPTIFAAVEPDNRGPIIPELTKLCPDAPVVVRSAANAWDTGLREAVASTGRSALVIVGSATELAVPLCALAAAEDGYDVYVLLDAPGLASETTRRLRDRVIVTSFSVVMEALG